MGLRTSAGWTDPLDPLKFKFLGFPMCQQPRKNVSTATGSRISHRAMGDMDSTPCDLPID